MSLGCYQVQLYIFVLMYLLCVLCLFLLFFQVILLYLHFAISFPSV